MNRRSLTLLVLGCIAALLGALLVTPGTASAQTRGGDDPRADGRSITFRGHVARALQGNGDIVGYRIGYERDLLRIVLRYRGLNFRSQGMLTVAVLQADTATYLLGLTTWEGNRQGVAFVGSTEEVVEVDEESSTEPVHSMGRLLRPARAARLAHLARAGDLARTGAAACRVSHRMSYRDNRIVMQVPTRCIGSPRSLDVALATVTLRRGRLPFRIDTAPGSNAFQPRFVRVPLG